MRISWTLRQVLSRLRLRVQAQCWWIKCWWIKGALGKTLRVSHSLSRVISLLLVIAISMLGLEGCAGTAQKVRLVNLPNPPELLRADEPRRLSGGISEVAPPAVLIDLRELMDRYEPQVAIASPRADQTLKSYRVEVKLKLKGLPIYKDEKLELGPHIQFILDNQPAKSVYSLDTPVIFEDLAPGSHTVRAIATQPWGESFKNEKAYAQATFHVLAKTEENSPDTDLPLITYLEPQGTYRAEPVLLDFYLNNVPLHSIAQQSSTDDIPDWRIRCSVNGQSFVFDRWQPIYLKGLTPGQNWVQLSLLDDKGRPIKNAFNNTVHTVSYDPQNKDALARIFRGELPIEKVGQIVVPDYEPPVIPASVIPDPNLPAAPEGLTPPEAPPAEKAVLEPEVLEPEVLEDPEVAVPEVMAPEALTVPDDGEQDVGSSRSDQGLEENLESNETDSTSSDADSSEQASSEEDGLLSEPDDVDSEETASEESRSEEANLEGSIDKTLGEIIDAAAASSAPIADAPKESVFNRFSQFFKALKKVDPPQPASPVPALPAIEEEMRREETTSEPVEVPALIDIPDASSDSLLNDRLVTEDKNGRKPLEETLQNKAIDDAILNDEISDDEIREDSEEIEGESSLDDSSPERLLSKPALEPDSSSSSASQRFVTRLKDRVQSFTQQFSASESVTDEIRPQLPELSLPEEDETIESQRLTLPSTLEELSPQPPEKEERTIEESGFGPSRSPVEDGKVDRFEEIDAVDESDSAQVLNQRESFEEETSLPETLNAPESESSQIFIPIDPNAADSPER